MNRVPATLSARIRTLGGTPHKTDGHDARSTALAGRHRDDLRLGTPRALAAAAEQCSGRA